MERIDDRGHAEIYNSMITKWEQEITELEHRIDESRTFDVVSRRKNEDKTLDVWFEFNGDFGVSYVMRMDVEEQMTE